MHILDARRERIELELVAEMDMPGLPALDEPLEAGSAVVRASRALFTDTEARRGQAAVRAPSGERRLAVFRERDSGLTRTLRHEIMVRFVRKVPAARRTALLSKFGLVVRSACAWHKDQVVVHDPSRRQVAAGLVDVSNALATTEEVVFATPNFVSQYVRHAAPKIRREQWHLRNLGGGGAVAGEDVRALEAWKTTRGAPSVVVAVLDDGVDLAHPDLKAALWRNPVASARDRHGRDFFVPASDPGHFDPSPKRFAFPFHEMPGNDIHGTPCAGVVAARGKGAWGIAPRCRVLAAKIFHADDLASDARVADAFRYAARHADILSCSWSGPRSPDIEAALEVDTLAGRGGKGCAVFCAAGNDGDRRAGFPASHADTVGVAASTDQARRADYSQTGPRIDLCAPSSGGVRGIFTTDVAVAGRGFNTGSAAAGGADGRYTNDFGGTSSATPLAAGIGALVLSVKPALTRDELRAHLRASCVRIDAAHGAYGADGHSRLYGYGRLDAAKAVGG